jgi:hypothetical protein
VSVWHGGGEFVGLWHLEIANKWDSLNFRGSPTYRKVRRGAIGPRKTQILPCESMGWRFCKAGESESVRR